MAAIRMRPARGAAGAAIAAFGIWVTPPGAAAGETATLVLRGVVPEAARVSLTPGPLAERAAGGKFTLVPGGTRDGGVVARIDGAANQGYDLLLVREPGDDTAYDLRYQDRDVRFDGERAVLAAAPVASHTVVAAGGALWLRSGGDDPVDTRITLVVRAR